MDTERELNLLFPPSETPSVRKKNSDVSVDIREDPKEKCGFTEQFHNAKTL